MSKSNARVWLLILLVTASATVACRTAELLVGANTRPTRTPRAAATRAPTKAKTSDATFGLEFVTEGTPRCTVGDDSASVVSGQVLVDGAPVVGQQVQASAGMGGEPISDEPAESDEDGNFQVTFVCDGNACDGAFWLWLVDADSTQISPFVKFVFDDQCRRGTVNFTNQ